MLRLTCKVKGKFLRLVTMWNIQFKKIVLILDLTLQSLDGWSVGTKFPVLTKQSRLVVGSRVFIRGCQKFGIKVYWRLQFLGYLRTLSLKFQEVWTKIEVVLTSWLPCWLSQLNWFSQQGKVRITSILVWAFWNFKLKVLKYSKNCSFQYTLIPWSLRKCDTP